MLIVICFARLHTILKVFSRQTLTGRSIANIIYGLGLMSANWQTLDRTLQEVIISELRQQWRFEENYPQHVANIYWYIFIVYISYFSYCARRQYY